jgi:transcriptional regulator with XRE-family HTH domain
MEVSVRASLHSLREAGDSVARELETGDTQGLGSVVLEVQEASRRLRERWRHLDIDSPFQETAEIAAEILRAAADAMGDSAAPPGLARELTEWERSCAGQRIRHSLRAARARLGGISLRDAARRSGLAPGHLSELEANSGSLPTSSTARRLDASLGTDITEILAELRRMPRRDGARRRHPGSRPELLAASSSALDPRLDALLARIAGDERLIRLNEDLLRLPAGARRGIAQMVRALVAENVEGR